MGCLPNFTTKSTKSPKSKNKIFEMSNPPKTKELKRI